jgi:hypothetical protein
MRLDGDAPDVDEGQQGEHHARDDHIGSQQTFSTSMFMTPPHRR